MIIIVVLLTLLFLAVAFLVNIDSEITTNPLLVYLNHQGVFIGNNYLFFFLGFIALTMVFIYLNFSKKDSRGKIYSVSLLQTIVITFFTLLLSYVLLFVIAFMQLNITAVTINIKPEFMGLITTRATIAERLQQSTRPPHIIATGEKQEDVLKAIASATSGTNTFYGHVVLSAIPSALLMSGQPIQSGMILIDETLLITQITSADMQAISPLIGYLFVKSYFSARDIKAYPKLAIMDKKEYLEFRKVDAKKKLARIDTQIKKIDGMVSSLSATLKTIDVAKERKQYALTQEQLSEYKYYANFFRTQKKAVQSMQHNVPHELGVFVPKETIKIIIESDNPHAIADYFATVTHEYLHYASYVSEKEYFTNAFFEEGLTEYFARNSIKESLNTSTNLGYPVQVRIISQMTEMIPESEFAEIYFTKDEYALMTALNRVYGDGFYENNYTLFESLQYTSNPKQVIKLANMIMARIGGQELTEKDLVSTYSNL